MLYITLALDGLLMIALPIALAIVLRRRLSVRASLFGAGALTFIASQVVHLPLNFGIGWLFQQGVLPAPPADWKFIFNAVVGGLTAGLCEETARYIAYRWFLKTTHTWGEGLMFGVGHGGIEAIMLGVFVLVNFATIYTLQTTDLATLPEAARQQAQQALATFAATPPLDALLGAVERVFALCLHLAMSLLVLQAVLRRNLLLLGAAIGWHASVNAIALLVNANWGAYATEAVLGVTALAAMSLIVFLRKRTAPPVL